MGVSQKWQKFVEEKLSLKPHVPSASYLSSMTMSQRVAQISCGTHHLLLFVDGGKCFSWGVNDVSQLGHESSSSCAPHEVDLLGAGFRACSIACGPRFSFAVEEATGALFGWGANECGQLGHGVTSKSARVPQQALLPEGVCATRVFAGSCHAFCESSRGQFYSWGSDLQGQLGQPAGGEVLVSRPQPVSFLNDELPLPVRQVACGVWQTLALTAAGEVWVAGVVPIDVNGGRPTGMDPNGDEDMRDAPFKPVPHLQADAVYIAAGGRRHAAIVRGADGGCGVITWAAGAGGERGAAGGCCVAVEGEALLSGIAGPERSADARIVLTSCTAPEGNEILVGGVAFL
eukprot:Polyplicarium_translucidae@DN454_c0_g1_i1.p1